MSDWLWVLAQAAGDAAAPAVEQAADGDPARPWTFAFVIITFMAYLYIGWRSRVRETQGFYVAGRGVPAIANGAATAADWMSAASFISMAGMISFAGSDGSIYLMGWTGGYVLLALLLAPYLRKFGKYTVPDFVGSRYYSETARIVAAICAVFVSLTYVAGQMKGVGVVFSRFLEVPLTAGVVIGMVIVAFFAVLGGMKGITWTQVLQYGVLIVAFLVPSFAIAHMLTDGAHPFPQSAFTFSDLPAKLNEVQADLGFGEYTAPFTNHSMLNVLCITAALMFGTAGLPHVIVRFYTVKSVKAARWSAGWALLFIALLYTTAPALGMFARYNLLSSLDRATIESIEVRVHEEGAEEDQRVRHRIAGVSEAQRQAAYDAVMAARDRARQDILSAIGRQTTVIYRLTDKAGKPIRWANRWQETGLLVFNDETSFNEALTPAEVSDVYRGVKRDGLISTVALLNAAGKPVQSEDVQIDRDIIVISTPEVAGLPPWVIALVAAGGLAAALSTAAGLLLVISSSIAHDLYIHFLDPKASEARRVMVGRIMIVLAIVVAGYFGVNPPGFVAETVAFAFGLAAASFFPAILLGIFDKRTNRQGAIAGMIVGIGFTGVYILGNAADKIIPGVDTPWFGLIEDPKNYHWFFGINPQGIGTIGMLLNFAVTFAISHVTAPPPAEVQELVESVRVPRGAHEPEAHFDESDAEADNP